MLRRSFGIFLVWTAFGAGAARAAGPSVSIAKGPWVQRVTATSAEVRVEVDPPSPITLEIGGPGGAAKRTVTSAEPRALHAIPLTGLEPASHYPIVVKAQSATKDGSFTTAPLDTSDALFRFLVYGDNRTDAAAHAGIVRAMASASGDFLVHTGDFVDDGASRAEWQTFFDIERPLLKDRCLFSCVGNHELVDGAGIEYMRYFGPKDPPAGVLDAASPKRAALSADQLDGTFRWASARFFLLNGMVTYRAGASRAWLEKALENADREPGLRWRIVVVHHGPWSSGPHGNNALLLDANVPQMLRAHKVDLVLAGHDHIYERGAVDGLAYVVSGGGGAPTYRIKAPLPSARKLESVRHFVEASVTPLAIQFVVRRLDGSTVEQCGLKKDVGWDCDVAPPAVAAIAPSAVPAPATPPPSRCACHAVGGGSASATASAAAILAFLGAFGALFGRRKRRGVLVYKERDNHVQ